jgi:predicted HAD superfamily Cof-like phosphohydrolase
MDASESYDVVEQLDACIDMLYILAERTINDLDLKTLSKKVLIGVHKNNMTKVGPDGKVSRSPEGKILKPDGFCP